MSDHDYRDVANAVNSRLAYAEILRWRQHAKDSPRGWRIDIQPYNSPLYRATVHLEEGYFWVDLEELQNGEWVNAATRLQLDQLMFWAGVSAKARQRWLE